MFKSFVSDLKTLFDRTPIAENAPLKESGNENAKEEAVNVECISEKDNEEIKNTKQQDLTAASTSRPFPKSEDERVNGEWASSKDSRKINENCNDQFNTKTERVRPSPEEQDDFLIASIELLRDLNNASKNLQRLEKINDEKNSHIQQLEKKIDNLNSDMQDLQEENNKKNIEIQKLHEESNRNNTDIQRLQEENKKLDTDIQQYQAANQANHMKILDLQAANKNMAANMQQMQQERDEINKEKQSLQNENKSLSEIITLLQKQDTVMYHLQEEQDDINKEIQQLRQEKESMNTYIEGLRQQNESLNADMQRQRQERENLNTDIQRLQQQRGNMNTEVQRSQQQKSNVNRDVQRLRQQRKNMNRDIQRLEQQKNDINRDTQHLQQQRNNIRRDMQRFQQEKDSMTPSNFVETGSVLVSEEILGRGAYATVRKGDFCGTDVAVKEFHEIILSEYNLKMLKREINIASQCRHPNLLQFICATENDCQRLLIVTELMDMSLRALIEQRAREGLKIVDQEINSVSLDIARGLNYLHSKTPSPIIHRDVSSANVLLWVEDSAIRRAKISDYGSTNFMQVCNTANPGAVIYAAPEARHAQQDPKIDIYSYGVLLCEICICELPDPRSRTSQMNKISNAHTRRLVARCTDDSPQARPTMQEIVNIWSTNI